MNFIIVSYYTPGTPYELCVNTFVSTAKQFNIPTYIESYPTRGTWQKNTLYKPEFILNRLDRNPDCNIVFCDIDCIFRSYPILFEKPNFDFAARMFKGKELLSGTLFFRNNSISRDILNAWKNKNMNIPHQFDQINLNIAYNEFKETNTKVKFLDLPREYCFICDEDSISENAIIVHMQESRRVQK